MRRPKVLLIGFGPFPGVVKNPTAALVRGLARSKRVRAAARVKAAVLPVTYAEAARIPRRIAREKPEAVLMFGLAGRARMLRIETRGRNRASRKHPDAAGRTGRQVLVPGAPKRLSVTAPTKSLLRAARAAGLRARLSADAGSYICNAAIFRALHATAGRKAPLVAFVHIPMPRGQRRAGVRPPRPGAGALRRAGEAILIALARAAREAAVPDFR